MKFELFESKDKFYFRLKARNGQVILSSPSYAYRSACLQGIKSVQRHAVKDHLYERKLANDGRHMFNLMTPNKQIIGTSQMYQSPTSRDHGVEAVARIAPFAKIKDLD